MEVNSKAEIFVLAGVNGAGKSSIGGALLRAKGAEYFNPDEVARKLRDANPGMPTLQANSLAWQECKRRLETGIVEGTRFAFETTLGGKTIPRLLLEAATEGTIVRVWYAGLESVELHLQRVAARVRRGGHNIPEADIRKRWDGSRANLIRLIPYITTLRVYDNSRDGNPTTGSRPEPHLVLAIDEKQLSFPGEEDLRQTPEWAKAIVFAAYQHFGLAI